ncbi:MAG: alpha-ribazole phosphatase [Chitinophagales bacterium]|nr:alpha-ribazole phosphatase [Chitinophagales bacterium]
MHYPSIHCGDMVIYVIRHTPVTVAKDTCYGQSDVQVADSYKKDVSYFINELPQDFDIVYCSPLSRCKIITQTLGLQPVEFRSELMEMNFGEWENKKWNDINQDELNQWMNDFVNIPTPNGENLMMLFKRVSFFLDKIRQKPHQKVLIITHAGVIRCIWAYLLQIPLQNIFKIPISHQEIFIAQLGSESQNDFIKRII